MTDRKSWIALGIVLVIGVVAFTGLYFVDRYFGDESSGDQSAYVEVACRDWVKDRLKSPTSAKFSGENTTQTGNTYVVRGSVDAQNSFGAMIRSDYTCEAIHEGGSSRLVSLTGLGD